MTPADLRLLRATARWASARAAYLAEKRAADVFRCERIGPPGARDEGEQGAPCNRLWSHHAPPDVAWCGACLARDPVFRRAAALRRVARYKLRLLCALVDRRAGARR